MFSMLAVLTLEQAMGQFHQLFFLFPVFLFAAAWVIDILNYYGKTKAFVIAHWLIILGVIACIPTILTGIAAEGAFNTSEYFVEKHRYLGFATGVSGSLYAGLRISSMLWRLPLKPIHFVFLSTLLVALVLWTSDYGVLIHSA